MLNLFECVNHISTFDFPTLSVHWLADLWNREEVTAPYAEVLDGFGLLHPDSVIFHTICQHFKLKAKFATMSFSSFSNPRSRIQNQKLPVNINHLLVASQNLLVDRISSNVSRSQLTKSRSPRAPKRRNVSSRRRSGSSVGWGARVLRVLMGLLRHVGPPGETGNG